MSMMAILLISLFVLFALWIFSTSLIDSEHYNRGQWVKDKRSRWFNRSLVISGFSMAGYLITYDWTILFVFPLLFMGTFDNTLNMLREDVLLLHLGSGNWWDDTWKKWPKSYVVMIISTTISSIWIFIDNLLKVI